MADIVAGMTIQAAWFKNIDTDGNFKKTVTFVPDTVAIDFSVNSVKKLSLDDDGNLTITGGLSDNTTI